MGGSRFRSVAIDHRQSGIDHRQSAIDHRQSAIDHRQSGIDHRQSGIDHRQYEPDQFVRLFARIEGPPTEESSVTSQVTFSFWGIMKVLITVDMNEI